MYPEVQINMGHASKRSLSDIIKLKGNPNIEPKYINTYLTNRMLGGMEEGGWWFEVGEPLESILVLPKKRESQKNYDQRVNDLFNKKRELVDEINQDERPSSSVLCDGWTEVCLEDQQAEYYPKTRPHYE